MGSSLPPHAEAITAPRVRDGRRSESWLWGVGSLVAGRVAVVTAMCRIAGARHFQQSLPARPPKGSPLPSRPTHRLAQRGGPGGNWQPPSPDSWHALLEVGPTARSPRAHLIASILLSCPERGKLILREVSLHGLRLCHALGNPAQRRNHGAPLSIGRALSYSRRRFSGRKSTQGDQVTAMHCMQVPNACNVHRSEFGSNRAQESNFPLEAGSECVLVLVSCCACWPAKWYPNSLNVSSNSGT